MAEAGGFEPPRACALAVFKTAAIGRSATPPSAGEPICAFPLSPEPIESDDRGPTWMPSAGSDAEKPTERFSFAERRVRAGARPKHWDHFPFVSDSVIALSRAIHSRKT